MWNNDRMTEGEICFATLYRLEVLIPMPAGREEAVKTTFTLTCLHCRGGGKEVRQ